LQVVFIFGPTASGKLTIASEVASITGFRLFPDHLAVNLVKGVFDYGMRAFTRTFLSTEISTSGCSTATSP